MSIISFLHKVSADKIFAQLLKTFSMLTTLIDNMSNSTYALWNILVKV